MSSILETRMKIKTNYVFIKDNVGSQKIYNKELLAIVEALIE